MWIRIDDNLFNTDNALAIKWIDSTICIYDNNNNCVITVDFDSHKDAIA